MLIDETRVLQSAPLEANTEIYLPDAASSLYAARIRAYGYRHQEISPKHIFAGILDAKHIDEILQKRSDPEDMRRAIGSYFDLGKKKDAYPSPTLIPFSSESIAALNRSLQIAEYEIDSSHLLRALIERNDDPVQRFFRKFGIGLEEIYCRLTNFSQASNSRSSRPRHAY